LQFPTSLQFHHIDWKYHHIFLKQIQDDLLTVILPGLVLVIAKIQIQLFLSDFLLIDAFFHQRQRNLRNSNN